MSPLKGDSRIVLREATPSTPIARDVALGCYEEMRWMALWVCLACREILILILLLRDAIEEPLRWRLALELILATPQEKVGDILGDSELKSAFVSA